MCRGGSNFYGGPLWSDMLESKRDFLKYDPEIPLYDAPVIQYVGHTTVNPEEQTVSEIKTQEVKFIIVILEIVQNIMIL